MNKEQANRNGDKAQNASVNQQDIPFYQKLGIRPRMARSFYAGDLVSFFKESIQNESNKKGQEIQKDLSTFVEFMENERLASWEAYNQDLWQKLLTFSYLDLSYEQNTNQTKSFYRTIQAFADWLTARKSVPPFGEWVKTLETQYQESVLQAVHVLELYQEQVENPFLTGYGEIKREALYQNSGDQKLSEGVFEVHGKSENTMEVKSLMTKEIFDILISKEITDDIQAGTTLIGVIKESAPDQWEILTLDRVFPPAAKPYLYKAIGL